MFFCMPSAGTGLLWNGIQDFGSRWNYDSTGKSDYGNEISKGLMNLLDFWACWWFLLWPLYAIIIMGIQRYVNVDNSKRPQSKDMFNVDEKATWRHMTTSWHVTSMDVWPAPPPLIAMSSTLVACWNNFNRYFCRYVYVWPTNKSQTSWISPIFTNTYKLFQHISTIPKPVSTVSMCSPWTNPILPQISASP